MHIQHPPELPQVIGSNLWCGTLRILCETSVAGVGEGLKLSLKLHNYYSTVIPHAVYGLVFWILKHSVVVVVAAVFWILPYRKSHLTVLTSVNITNPGLDNTVFISIQHVHL